MSTANDDETLAFLAALSEAHKQGTSPQPRPMRRRNARDNFFAGFQTANAGSRGGFSGGSFDRITEEWNPGSIGPNRLLQNGAGVLRERARDLVINNPGASSAVESYISNVIECGITPTPQIADKGRRKLWLRGWNRWCGLTPNGKYECDIENDSTFYELSTIWLSEIIVAGGCLTHYVELPRRGRTIPLTLELLPEERFVTHLDTWGRNPKTANQVINGVEIDSNGRALSYLVTRTRPNDLNYDPEDPIRLPAEQCEYAFFKRQPGQKRGWSLLSSVVVWLWALGYYTDNELHASSIKSSWAYMITTDPDNDMFAFPDLNDELPERGTTDIYGNSIEKMEPGMVFRGSHGDDIKPVGPNVPGGDSMPWLNMIQRSIAIGTNQSYEEVFRDYGKGSFSSVRAAMNSDRKRYRKLQRFTIGHWSNPTVSRFVQHASRAGLEGFPTPSDFVANQDEWLEIDWNTPGWESVNPKDDATAQDIKLRNHTTTRRKIVEGSGNDYETHMEQVEVELAEDERLGINQPEPVPASNSAQNPPADEDDDAENESDTEDSDAATDS